MSYTIPDNSPKRQQAIRVGNELTRALESQHLSLKALSRALGGTSHTKLWQYKRGRILPRLATALEISEALNWPRIAELVREFRSAACHQCGRMFVMEGGSGNKRYCSDRCRSAAGKLRDHMGDAENAEDAPERRLVARLKSELVRVRGRTSTAISRLEVKDAVAEFERTSPHSRKRRIQNQLNEHMLAVEAFCNGCEPEGMCRDAECVLRPVSPLPLGAVREVDMARPAPGPWSEENRPRQLTAIRQANAERWSRPGERDRARAATTAMWANLTPEERADWSRKISVAKRGKPSSRPCGCQSRAHRRDCPTRAAVPA